MLGYYHHGAGWGGWLVMALSMVAFWGLVVWAVIVIFRADPTSTPDKRDPHQILDERFARGDIDEPEYRQRQDILRTSAPAGSVPPPVATPRRP